MIRLAFIGSSMIAGKFAEAVQLLPDTYTLDTIYSRTEETGRSFANQYGFTHVVTSMETLAETSSVDAVYIASPNICHFAQCKLMLEHGKHVLCEKPLTTALDEEKELFALAKEKHLILLEAMRPAFDPSTQVVMDNLERLGTIRRVDLPYCQDSSRYDKFKEGIVTNIFNPAMGGGALFDLGIYPIYYLAMVMGLPQTLHHIQIPLRNNVTGCGAILAGYPESVATVTYSKINESALPATIQGEKGYLTINKMNDPSVIKFCDGKGHEEVLYERGEENNMIYEARAFAEMIDGKRSPEIYEHYSLTAMQIIEGYTTVK